MGNTSAEADIRRAKAVRGMKKGVRDAEALAAIDDAAARLEKRAARKLRKVGRKGKARRIGTIATA
jgi:ribosome-associated translation inhibitor RaiA